MTTGRILRSSGITVNFKGFVGDRKNNTGEDRGYSIDTGTDLMNRYSLYKKDEFYEIVVSRGNDVLGRLVVKLTPARMDYVVLRVNSQRYLFLRSGDRVSLSSKDKIYLEEIQTNLYSKKGIHLIINGHKIRLGEVRNLKELCTSTGCFNDQIDVKKGPLVLGRIFIDMFD